MRKLSTILLLALLATPAFFTPSAASVPLKPADPASVTICYFGVTLTVSQSLAERYYKLGAKPGACGGTVCPPGFFAFDIPFVGTICFPLLPLNNPLIQEPNDLQKAIQLNQPTDALTEVLWSLKTERIAAK